ncbi:hypothetical protein F0562_036171 [Nyssa sinensis]|uniref:Uncharacterized protein n=1 Tax=Nyssa sinensis TaxID=561372 RepID=A0A5J5AGE9_9ASTE|nr:hypothetical protein F0562_036171 [Nyssa sinensis]
MTRRSHRIHHQSVRRKSLNWLVDALMVCAALTGLVLGMYRGCAKMAWLFKSGFWRWTVKDGNSVQVKPEQEEDGSLGCVATGKELMMMPVPIRYIGLRLTS